MGVSMVPHRHSKKIMNVDVCIIGGGLAGLTAALGSIRMGLSVLVIEKKKYPFHKVCGEYISLEAEGLLEWMDLPLDWKSLPRLDTFRYTGQSGKNFTAALPLGGMGISRFWLDDLIRIKIEAEGGIVLDGTRALDFSQNTHGFTVFTDSQNAPVVSCSWLLGTMGRNKSRFAHAANESPPTRRYIGVKRHVRANLPHNRIELLAFPGGYCGISAVEGNNRFCLCYLASESVETRNLEEFETTILKKNPVLRQYLTDFEPLTNRVATSGVFFQSRPLSQNGMLFIGDSAGMIPPLAGNGMSMAMHGAVLALEAIYLAKIKNWDLDKTVQFYQRSWKQSFSTRLSIGGYFNGLWKTNGRPRPPSGFFLLHPWCSLTRYG
jgi:menaquinone-9 beta-reductase